MLYLGNVSIQSNSDV